VYYARFCALLVVSGMALAIRAIVVEDLKLGLIGLVFFVGASVFATLALATRKGQNSRSEG